MLIIKSFYRKRRIKNYLIILLNIVFIITFSIFSKNYIKYIYNKNFERSFILVKINESNDYNVINKKKYVENIYKCIKDDVIIVEYQDVDDKSIIVSDLDNSNINELIVQKSNFIQPNIYMISPNKFKDYKHDNEYYITIKSWLYRNEYIDYLIENNISIEPYIYMNNNIQLDGIFIYLDLVIILLFIIGMIIYVFTTINLLIDEKKNNNLYHYLGYSNVHIVFYTLFKIISLNLICFGFNELFQIFLNIILKNKFHINVYIYILMIALSSLFTILLTTKLKSKSVFKINIKLHSFNSRRR